jgi:alkaline phosphatase
MPPESITRRSFIQAGSLLAATGARAEEPAPVRFGVITDLHYADRDSAGDRHYRAALGKLEAAVAAFNAEPLDFVIQLGDFIDEGATVEAELEHLRRAEAVYARARAPRHYVLGNHCVWSLTRDQFYGAVAGRRAPYSFDVRGWHFVVLDACFRADGKPYGAKNFEWLDSDIPAAQRDWLARDLEAAPGATVVFVHQRLDVETHYGVKSARAVREILAASGKVRAVFQGHNHLNEVRTQGGIPYVTLEAAIEGAKPESNAYGFVTCSPASIQVEGRLRQESHRLDVPWSFPLRS